MIKPKVTFDSKETTVVINNVRIQAIPSHHVSAGRGILLFPLSL
jgi:hypothetical protein